MKRTGERGLLVGGEEEKGEEEEGEGSKGETLCGRERD